MTGRYKVRKDTLIPLYADAREALRGVKVGSWEHVFRENNTEADRLANEAIDRGTGRGALPQHATHHATTHAQPATPAPPAAAAQPAPPEQPATPTQPATAKTPPWAQKRSPKGENRFRPYYRKY